VASRTSAFRFKDAARDLHAIGETLGVTTLLEGSVRTAGTRLRVTAQVVNASDGYQLWSERFDRKMEDVFEVQDEIAKRVVEALKLRLSSKAPTELRHSNDIDAYQLFLKGRHFRYTKLDLKSALRCFEEAVARDPDYALARIGMAETLVILVIYGMIPPSAGQARAKEELRKARELAGESAQARGVEALVALLYDWDTRAALEGFERALELDPTSIPVRAWCAWALLAGGRPDEAVEQARRIVQMDPQSPYASAMAGFNHILADRVDEAIKLERRALEIAPDSLLATWALGLALGDASAWEEANEWLSRAVDRSSRAPFYLGMLAWCQAASGSHEQARQTLGELERRAATEYVSPIFLALAFSELGDSQRTRTLLEEAFTERASILVLRGMPCLRQLRAEPLMEDLRRRLLGEGGESKSG
jgi:adenylate cyclase